MTDSSSAARRAPSMAAAVRGTLLLAFAVGIAGVAQGSFGTLQEAAKVELHLSDYALGAVQGLALALPIAVLSVFIGRAVDQFSRARMILVIAAIWTAGTFLTAAASGFAGLFAARMLAGLGLTAVLPAAISMAADLCDKDHRGRALLVLTIGKIAGQAGAFALAGWLFGWLATRAPLLGLPPWRGAHLLLGIGCAVCIAPLLLLKEPERQEVALAHASVGGALAELAELRAFLIPLFIGEIGVGMADIAALIWAAPVLGRTHHLLPSQFAGWMGLVILGSGTLGSLAGGFIADAGQRSARRGGILTGAVIASGIGIPAALFAVAPGVTDFAWTLGLLLFCGTIAGLVTATAIAVLVPNELRGVCVGAFLAVANVVGLGVAPPLVTSIAALIGGESSLGKALSVVGVGTGCISFIGFFLALRRAPLAAATPAPQGNPAPV
jgi:MFS family permease